MEHNALSMFQARTMWRFAMMALQCLRVHSVLPSLKAAIQPVFECTARG